MEAGPSSGPGDSLVFTGSEDQDVALAKSFWNSATLQPPLESRLIRRQESSLEGSGSRRSSAGKDSSSIYPSFDRIREEQILEQTQSERRSAKELYLQKERVFPAPLKHALVHPLLKKPSLDPTILANFRPVSNFPFLGKVLEKAVSQQLQEVLDEVDYSHDSGSDMVQGLHWSCCWMISDVNGTEAKRREEIINLFRKQREERIQKESFSNVHKPKTKKQGSKFQLTAPDLEEEDSVKALN